MKYLNYPQKSMFLVLSEHSSRLIGVKLMLVEPQSSPCKLSSLIEEFENSEAKEINVIKDVSRDVFSTLDKNKQIAKVEENEHKFKGTHMSSKEKQKVYDNMGTAFEDLRNKTKRFSEFKKSISLVTDQARVLFKAKDPKKSGFISGSDLKKIFRALNLDPSDFIQSLDANAKISIDKMVSVVEDTFTPMMNKSQIKDCFGTEKCLDISEIAVSLANIGLKAAINPDNCLCFNAIEDMLND